MKLDEDRQGEVTFEMGRWHENTVAERVSSIVWGDKNPVYPFKKGENESWDLGGNDWFLLVEGNVARLTHRYGSAFSLEYWKALRLVIEVALHGGHYQRGDFAARDKARA